MSLVNQLHKLDTQKLYALKQVINEAALASEIRGNHQARLIFRRAKNRTLGLQKRIYAAFEIASPQQLENLKTILLELDP